MKRRIVWLSIAALLAAAPAAAAQAPTDVASSSDGASCNVTTENIERNTCTLGCTADTEIHVSLDQVKGEAAITFACGGSTASCHGDCEDADIARTNDTKGLCEIHATGDQTDVASGSCSATPPDPPRPPPPPPCWISVEGVICLREAAPWPVCVRDAVDRLLPTGVALVAFKPDLDRLEDPCEVT